MRRTLRSGAGTDRTGGTLATVDKQAVDSGAADRHRRGDPLWARLTVIAGALLMVASGLAIAGGKYAMARYTSPIGRGNLIGADARVRNHGQVRPGQPVNVLLLGVDTRPDNNEPIRADSIIVLHIPKEHDRAYLVSIPRDTIVEIPANPPGKPTTTHEKINGAFAYGSKDGRDRDAGFRLLSSTVTKLTGLKFDAGAIIDFQGFRAVVGALGGVDMCIDVRTESHHIGFDRQGRVAVPYKDDRRVPGVVPVVYEPGCRHLEGWQALDYVRQRYGLPNADYDRQRHQQQFLKAILKEAMSKGVITDPKKLDAVLLAAGEALTLDTGGIDPAEWLWAMKGIGDNSVTMLKTPGHSTFGVSGEPSSYRGEELEPAAYELFDALRASTLDQFVGQHPELINPDT